MFHRIKPTNKNFLNTRKYQSYPHYDVAKKLADWQWDKSLTLALACDFFNVPSPKDGPVSAASVAEAYAQGKIKEIAHYCEKDVASTWQIFKICHVYLP